MGGLWTTDEKKHTETNGFPSKGTRKAANALEHVFNPPLQRPSKLAIPGIREITYQISAQMVLGKHLPCSLRICSWFKLNQLAHKQITYIGPIHGLGKRELLLVLHCSFRKRYTDEKSLLDSSGYFSIALA